MDIKVNMAQVEATMSASKPAVGSKHNLPYNLKEENHLDMIKRINETNKALNLLFTIYQTTFINHLDVTEETIHTLVEKDQALSLSIRNLDGR